MALLTLLLVVAGAISVLGARMAEAARHPVRGKVPPVCPCVAHVRCRDVQVKSADGTLLRGWYYEPDNPNGGVVLALHGIGGTRTDVVALGTVFEKAGYAVLVPDLRGHGRSEGQVSYGVSDEADIRALADWMSAQPGITRLYGFGASLGASVLLESLKSESRFSAVLAESAFVDFPLIANERLARLAPASLRWMVQPLVASGILWTQLRYGVDMNHSSALEGVRKSRTPMLIAHGLQDSLTSPENSRMLAAASPNAQLWLMPRAGHANLWATDRAEFESRVLSWFGQFQ